MSIGGSRLDVERVDVGAQEGEERVARGRLGRGACHPAKSYDGVAREDLGGEAAGIPVGKRVVGPVAAVIRVHLLCDGKVEERAVCEKYRTSSYPSASIAISPSRSATVQVARRSVRTPEGTSRGFERRTTMSCTPAARGRTRVRREKAEPSTRGRRAGPQPDSIDHSDVFHVPR